MRLVIVTGMSGAGKSTTLKFLEDMGFFCADNLPPSLIHKLAEICCKPGAEIENLALGIDIRGGRLFEDLFTELAELDGTGHDFKILFLDASDEMLQKRYKESRRSHPLAKNERVITGIERERELLHDVKNQSDYIIDTSQTLTQQLKEKLSAIFIEGKKFQNLVVNVMSFGFKYGVPQDVDLVFDVRFIPNPFYIPEMREQTGNDAPVREFVLSHTESSSFLQKLYDMLEFLLPCYIKEGKNQLVIGVGCTGGRHRSVALANELYSALLNRGHYVTTTHRDIDRWKAR